MARRGRILDGGDAVDVEAEVELRGDTPANAARGGGVGTRGDEPGIRRGECFFLLFWFCFCFVA